MASTTNPADRWPLGVFTSIDAGFGVRLDVAKELGVPTLHVHTPHPEQRTAENAEKFLADCVDGGCTVTVLFAGFDGESYASISVTEETVGLVPRATRASRAAEAREIATFGRQLGCPVLGMHIGFVPDPASGAEAKESYEDLLAVTQSLLDELADHGQRVHLETGQETAEHLLHFLHDVDRPNIGVNFDPANMILYGTGDPIEALRQIGPHVGSIHCKDAVAADEAVRGAEWGREVALGEGDVGLERYLTTLKQIGYEGPLTIERELSEKPEEQKADIQLALGRLEELRGKVLSTDND